MVDDTHSEKRTNREISNANLIHIKPGQTLNPGGRPKDPGITAIQIQMLDTKCPYDAKGRTWREYLAEKGLLLAVNKEGALEHLKERLEGKVPDKHEIETGDISIVYKQVKKKENED